MDIFVVDDEVVIVETLAIILRAEGYSVCSFNEASAVLEALHLGPRLLITDYRLPVSNGIELLLAVRRSMPECLAILFTADFDECRLDCTDRVVESATTALMRKPLHPSDLLRCVDSLLAEVM